MQFCKEKYILWESVFKFNPFQGGGGDQTKSVIFHKFFLIETFPKQVQHKFSLNHTIYQEKTEFYAVKIFHPT